MISRISDYVTEIHKWEEVWECINDEVAQALIENYIEELIKDLEANIKSEFGWKHASQDDRGHH